MSWTIINKYKNEAQQQRFFSGGSVWPRSSDYYLTCQHFGLNKIKQKTRQNELKTRQKNNQNTKQQNIFS